MCCCSLLLKPVHVSYAYKDSEMAYLCVSQPFLRNSHLYFQDRMRGKSKRRNPCLHICAARGEEISLDAASEEY